MNTRVVNGVIATCPHCGGEVRYWKNYPRTFCSQACYYASLRQDAERLLEERNAKICSQCKEEKPIEEFSIANSAWCGRAASCKKCVSAYAKKRRLTKEGYEESRNSQLKQNYGMTLEFYNVLLSAQDGVCAICGKPETSKGQGGRVRQLSVDHCHKTGTVRGLLCSDCNTALGMFGDDEERLSNAINYLVDSEFMEVVYMGKQPIAPVIDGSQEAE